MREIDVLSARMDWMSLSSCCSCGSGDAEASRVGKTILGDATVDKRLFLIVCGNLLVSAIVSRLGISIVWVGTSCGSRQGLAMFLFTLIFVT